MKATIVLAALALTFSAVGCRQGQEPDPQPGSGTYLNAHWYVASGDPPVLEGEDGDLYLDTETTMVYVRTDGVWVSVAALRGPSGSAWLHGPGAPSASLGLEGDLYLDTSSTVVYRKSSGTWTVLCALQGAAGATGTTGPAGADGATWLTGSGDPNDAEPPIGATAGDLYLDVMSTVIYKFTGSLWLPLLALQSSQQYVFTPNFPFPLLGITYGNELFVAVGAMGTVLTSSDGTEWELVQLASPPQAQSLLPGSRARTAAPASRGLVEGEYGSDIAADLYGIVYGNNTFVAVGGGEEKIFTSSGDATSWIPVAEGLTGSAGRLNGVVYDGTRFLAVGYYDDGLGSFGPLVISSQDSSAVSWAECSLEGDFDPNDEISGCAFSEGRYVAVGYGGTILTCTGPVEGEWTWTDSEVTVSGTSTPYLYGVTYGNGTFVAVGYEDDYGAALILLSDDGLSWTTQDVPLGSYSCELYGVTSGPGGFVAVGYDSGDALVLTSPNGVSWSLERWQGMPPFFAVAWGPVQGGLYAIARLCGGGLD